MFLVLIASIMAISMIYANGTKEDEIISSERITLKFIHIWPEHQEVMEESISIFEEKNPTIDVEISVVPWNEIFKQLQISIASEDVYDVAFMWTHDMGGWVDMDAAMDLTPYLDNQFTNQLINKDILNSGKLGNKYYNIPFRGTSFFIGFNKSIFREYGWKEPANLAEFETLMDDMISNGVTPFAVAGKPKGYQVTEFLTYFLPFEAIPAGLYDDPNYIIGRKTGAIEPNAAALERLARWYDSNYFGKTAMAITREEAHALFSEGKGVMLFFNNNEISHIRKLLPEDTEFDVFPFPIPENISNKVIIGGFDGFFASSDTKYPEESIALLKHMISPEVQKLWADKSGSTMVIKGISYDDPVVQEMSSYFGDIGRYYVNADYNQGDLQDKRNQLYVEYLLKRNMSATEVAEKLDGYHVKALKEAGIQ